MTAILPEPPHARIASARRRSVRRLFAVLPAVLALFAAGAPHAAGQDSAARQQRLEQLRARIARVQSDMERDLKRRSAAELELRELELRLARLDAGLRALNAEISAAQTRLAKLRRQQAAAQANLEAQKQALAAQIRAAYQQGQDSELRLLLNAEDPATLGRLLAYYDYLNRARAQRIEAVRTQLEVLSRLNAGLQRQLAALSELRAQRSDTQARLERTHAERRRLIGVLDARLKSRAAQLAQLQRDARALESLLSNLRHALADIPADLEKAHRFSALKGRLSWPVAGRLLHRFGEPLVGGRLPAQGDLIGAAAGTPVRAVAYGRVVYADWLARFGLLVIIDHGDGYMSIYAHNRTLAVQVGDWVRAGQTIATLGDSGGQNRPALYFELRHRNTALDPRRWCRGSLPRG